MITRQAFDTIFDVQNLPLAATVFAHDIPLHAAMPYSVTGGDGIKGRKVTFHFGEGARAISDQWFSPAWIRDNPNHSVSVCRGAFAWLETLRNHCSRKDGVEVTRVPLALHTQNTRIAAILCRLGHPVKALWRDGNCSWHFPIEAGPDLALVEDSTLYDMMPTAPIAYAKAALFGHMAMLDFVGNITHYRVTHRGREAIIGRNMPKAQLEIMEKLLYRK